MAPAAQDAPGCASGRQGTEGAAVCSVAHAHARAVTIRLVVLGILIPAALVRARGAGAQEAPCVSQRAGSVPATYAGVVARERTLVCERLRSEERRVGKGGRVG